MTVSHAPTPDDSTTLSPHEQRLLRAIEDDLRASDPSFAHHFTMALHVPAQARATVHHRSLLIAALLILLAVMMVPRSWHAALGLIMAFGLLPWLLLRTARSHPPSP